VVSLPIQGDEGVKVVKDLLNVIPEETQVDLTLEHSGTILSLRDLLTLFTALKSEREVASTLRL
jgi:hypothetical protein